MPGIIPGGYWEDAFKIYFAMVFLWGLKAWAVDSPSKDLYVGIGAFNLVRRSAYEGIDGHETLRLEVVKADGSEWIAEEADAFIQAIVDDFDQDDVQPELEYEIDDPTMLIVSGNWDGEEE